MLKLEPRAQPSKLMSLLSPVLALVLTAILAGILFAVLGKDPVRGLAMYFVEPFANLRQISELVLKATPLIVIALGLAVCYRSNVWNIGAEGQFLLGIIAGGGVALWLTTHGIVLPKIVAVPTVVTPRLQLHWNGPAPQRRGPAHLRSGCRWRGAPGVQAWWMRMPRTA